MSREWWWELVEGLAEFAVIAVGFFGVLAVVTIAASLLVRWVLL